jgi:hypothetical protein
MAVLGPYGSGNLGHLAGTSGHNGRLNIQASARSWRRPARVEASNGGFESHLTAAACQRPLPTRQASPRTGLTLPPRWCHRRQARAIFTLAGRARTCPKHRSTVVIHGQPRSMSMQAEL